MKTVGNAVIVVVGYRNAGDIRSCLMALSRSTETEFSVSVCENGGVNSFTALVSAIEDIVEADEDQSGIGDRISAVSENESIVGYWSGRLRPNNQRVQIHLAAQNLGYAGGVNLCIR